MMIFAVFNLL